MTLDEALKRDIAHVGDLVRNSSGDIDTISGLSNLKNALFHRLMTVPGTLVHRPTYGVGLPLYQNGLSAFSVQQKLASVIEEQFLQDPRVEAVKSIAVENSDSNPQETIIKISVKIAGYTEQEMKFTPFSGGGL